VLFCQSLYLLVSSPSSLKIISFTFLALLLKTNSTLFNLSILFCNLIQKEGEFDSMRGEGKKQNKESLDCMVEAYLRGQRPACSQRPYSKDQRLYSAWLLASPSPALGGYQGKLGWADWGIGLGAQATFV